MLTVLNQVNKGLAAQVAYGLGLPVPETPAVINQTIPADVDPQACQPVKTEGALAVSEALSMAGYKADLRTRKVAILVADGVDDETLATVRTALLNEGAVAEVIAPRGIFITAGNEALKADKILLTVASVLYDAVYLPGGANSVATLEADADTVHFLNEAYKHCKPIAAAAGALPVLEATYFSKKLPEDNSDETVMREGIVIGSDASDVAQKFTEAMRQHRFREREKPGKVPA